MNLITMSAIMVTLFFGGPDGPGFHFVRWLWPILWFLGKTVVFLYVYVWIRAALPRLRYDQLMDLGWKRLIPLSLAWLLVIAAVRLHAGDAWGFAVFGGCLVAGAALWKALQVSRRRRELQAVDERTDRPARIFRPAGLRPVRGGDGGGGQ